MTAPLEALEAVHTWRQLAISTKYLRMRSGGNVPMDMAAPLVAFSTTEIIDTWYQSDWVGNTQIGDDGKFYRLHQLLIGPANGGVVIPKGSYRAYRILTDLPEVPVDIIGTLIIF